MFKSLRMTGRLRAARQGKPQPRQQSAALGLTLLAGGLVGLALGRRWRQGPPPMPHHQEAAATLAAHQGEAAAAVTVAQMQTRYAALRQQQPRFRQPALQWHFDRQILPGLAFYLTLREGGMEQAAAFSATESFFQRAFSQAQQLLPALARTPDPFAAFRWLSKLAQRFLFPRDGWQITQYEDNHHAYAFTVHRCFYKDVLTAYGAPELTPLYCHLDDATFARLPATILWQRTQTLGRGDDCCDFRWQRAQHSTNGAPVAADVEEPHPL